MELLALLGLLVCSAAIIAAVVWFYLFVLGYMAETGVGSTGMILAMLWPAFLAYPFRKTLVPLWKGYLRFYRYDTNTLQPMSEDKEKQDDSNDH